MIDYAPDGRHFIIADGRDLLAHIGQTEAPAWRIALPGPALAIGQTPVHVVAATADGSAMWFDRATGRVAGHMHAGAPLVAGAANRAGRVVVLTPDGRLLGVNTGAVPLAPISGLAGANRVGLAEDGRSLIATAGWLTELDRAGRMISQTQSPPIAALAWHPTGVWYAAGGRNLWQYQSGRLTHIAELPADRTADFITAGQAGVGVAGASGLRMYDPARFGGAPILDVTYPDRVVTGISLGPQTWLAVALAGGDANKIDYLTGTTHRSDTHPGRKHNSWTLLIKTGKKADVA